MRASETTELIDWPPVFDSKKQALDRIPKTAPFIQPLVDVESRPLWSVMIPAYNCSAYLEEAIRSVLAQDMGEERMQIEVVDDASTDADVAEIVKTIGLGRVKYFRQPNNLGSLRNFETCINRARGHYVHLLHGDDRVRVGFYEKVTELFTRFPEAGAAFCRCAHIDSDGKFIKSKKPEMKRDGILNDWLLRIAELQRIQYACMVVKRSVYEQLGSFYGVTYGEDWEMWARIAHKYPTAYTPRVLAEYRGHDGSISNQKLSTGQALEDLRIVIDTIHNYLPEADKDRITAQSKKYYAIYGVTIAFQRWKETGQFKNLYESIIHASRLYAGIALYITIVKLIFKTSLKYTWGDLVKSKKLITPMNAKTWDWEITQQTKWQALNIKELWGYRNLLARLIRRDYLVSYQQTLLGPLWTLVQPILTVATYVLVFGNLMQISTGEIPPALFYLTGTILWGLFSDVFSGTSTTFTDNADLFSKVYFPRLVMPLALVTSQLVRLSFQVILIVLGLLYFWYFQNLPLAITPAVLLAPVVLVGITSLGLGLGLLVAVATAKYRDLLNVIMLVMRMLLFVTPVFYPLEVVSKKAQWVVTLNPLTPMFELFRYSLFGQGTFTPVQLLYGFGMTIIVLFSGILLFNKKKEVVMDTI